MPYSSANKANVEVKKKSRGLVTGSYVTLQKEEGPKYIAEGVETALSIKEAEVKGSVLAALGISNIRNYETTNKDQQIIICADNDGEGAKTHESIERFVQALQEKGYKVTVIRPENLLEQACTYIAQRKAQGILEHLQRYREFPNTKQLSRIEAKAEQQFEKQEALSAKRLEEEKQ